MASTTSSSSSTPFPTIVPLTPSPDPDNNVTIFCVTLAAASFIAVGLRLFSRIRTHTLGADDWASIPALILTIIHTVLAVLSDLKGGIGKPLWTVTWPEWTLLFKMILASAFLYPALTTSIRVTILLFYKRLFDRTNRQLHLATNIMLGLMVPYVVIYLFITGFLCHPPSAFWNPYIRNQHCNDDFYYHYSVSSYATGLGFDFVLLILPMRTIWRLRMSTSRKMSTLFMLALGTGACVAVATKLGFFVSEWNEASIPHHLVLDPKCKGNPLESILALTLLGAANPLSKYIPPAFATYGYTYWIPSQCEPCVALIGCSLPALRPLFLASDQKIRTAVMNYQNSRATEPPSQPGDSYLGSRRRTKKDSMNITCDSTEALHDTLSNAIDPDRGGDNSFVLSPMTSPDVVRQDSMPQHGITKSLAFSVERSAKQ